MDQLFNRFFSLYFDYLCFFLLLLRVFDWSGVLDLGFWREFRAKMVLATEARFG